MKLVSLHNLNGVAHEFYNSFGKTALATLIGVGVPLAYQALDHVTLDKDSMYYGVTFAAVALIRALLSALKQFSDNKKTVAVTDGIV